MDDCIFCRIIDGQIPSNTVYENELVKAFRDISPKAPVHVLIIPKKHFRPAELSDPANASYVSHIYQAAREIAAAEGIADSGFRLLTNCGPDAGQEVDHLHVHLLGGKPLGPMLVE